MSRLIMWNLVTLDGLFEGGTSWELEWHESVWGEELERLSIDQLRSAEMLVFGRVTYEGMAAYWSAAQGEVAELMNAVPKVVCSRTIADAGWNNTRLLRGDAAAEVRELKRRGDGNLFVFGSATLSATLIREGLFDEYRLGLVPVVLGRGRPLFERDQARRDLKLLEARALSTGCVLLRYEPS